MKIKFSVIVPVYNVEQYLRECVDSIMNQDYPNFEIILVDDGSKDRSSDICDEYAKNSDKVRVIHKENGGLSSARNTGIDAATGDYILFLDSDDFYCDDTAFTQFAKVLEEEQPDFLMYKLGKYYGPGNAIDFYGDYKIEDFQEDKAAIFQYMVKEHKQLACACNKITKRELVLSGKLYFELGTIAEDICWTVELFEKSNKISYINIMPYMYRQTRDSSITSNVTQKKLNDLYKIIDKLAVQYREDDSAFGQAVKAFLAFEYGILLLNMSRCKEEIDVDEYKGHLWVLSYAQDKKARLVRLAVRILGFKNAIKLLRFRKG